MLVFVGLINIRVYSRSHLLTCWLEFRFSPSVWTRFARLVLQSWNFSLNPECREYLLQWSQFCRILLDVFQWHTTVYTKDKITISSKIPIYKGSLIISDWGGSNWRGANIFWSGASSVGSCWTCFSGMLPSTSTIYQKINKKI